MNYEERAKLAYTLYRGSSLREPYNPTDIGLWDEMDPIWQRAFMFVLEWADNYPDAVHDSMGIGALQSTCRYCAATDPAYPSGVNSPSIVWCITHQRPASQCP